jgi:hypothetical protein
MTAIISRTLNTAMIPVLTLTLFGLNKVFGQPDANLWWNCTLDAGRILAGER